MKNSLLVLFMLVFTCVVTAQEDLYVRGDFNDWGTAGPVVDDGTNGDAVAGDSVYSWTLTIPTAGRYEWKIGSSDWSVIFPWAGGGDNSWIVTTVDNQEVIFTIDRSHHDDDFLPGWDIVHANDQPTGDVVCAGDHNGWNNAGSEVFTDTGDDLMGDWMAGDGIYAFSFNQATAGTYSWKPVLSGTWDTWLDFGRTVSSNNLSYTTDEDDVDVFCYLDMNTSRIATVLGDPLPVELNMFTAVVIDKSVLLNWETASELNNRGFEIERKAENGNWGSIAFIDGKGTSNELNKYTYTDNPGSGSYSYRLKQIDFDGSYTYSGYVNVELYVPKSYNLSQNFPNPFNPVTTIKFDLANDGVTSLEVYNLLGEKVATLVNESMAAGSYEYKFNAAELTSGMYLYKLTSNGTAITKKMMLLK